MSVPGLQSPPYEWMLIRKFSQPVPYMGPYCTKDHNQRESKIEEAQEAPLTLCQATPPVVFHPDALVLSPSVLTRGAKWPALPAHAETAHASPALTETASPNPPTPAATGSGKINSNHARPTYGQIAPPSPPADPDSDVTSVASFGGSYGESDYVELAKNSPIISSKTPDLKGHTRKLEKMHKVSEGEINAIVRPTVLFSHIDEIKIPELADADADADAETDPPENLQDIGATSPVSTQPYPPHSPLEDTLVASAKPPPCHRVWSGDASLQAREVDLWDVCLMIVEFTFI